MKSFLNSKWVLINVIVLMFIGATLAAAPTVPGIQDVLSLPFGTIFAQTASLVAVLNLIGAGARHFLKLQDLALYSTVVVAGLVLGIVGQYAGLLTVADYVNVPAPWGGIAFGFAGALQAVGVNQGKRQLAGQSSSTGNAPSHPANTSLPKSG